jgi:hypothetical protein
MPTSWSDIIGGEVSFTESLNETWGRWLGGSSESSDESTDDESEQSSGDSDEWWYAKNKYNWLNGDERVRMALMQSPDEAETIEVEVYHQGEIEAARVVAVYAEFALRDAWGDQYHVDVSVNENPVRGVKESDDFAGWVNEHTATAKDANLLVASDGGWDLEGGGDSAVCQWAEKIANYFYGQPLNVEGNDRPYSYVNTGLHEILHCLGFDHKDGGRISSAITPMGRYGNNGNHYTARLHPNVRAMEPEVQ